MGAAVLGQPNTWNSYSNNVYLLISSSKFYFNYRHTLNVLAIYQYLKSVGITDD
jgi:glycosylphosphatidylinositol transamidase (GPIT) subunit GPI8